MTHTQYYGLIAVICFATFLVCPSNRRFSRLLLAAGSYFATGLSLYHF